MWKTNLTGSPLAEQLKVPQTTTKCEGPPNALTLTQWKDGKMPSPQVSGISSYTVKQQIRLKPKDDYAPRIYSTPVSHLHDFK